MKPETNLFLRSLIGKEKARLIAEKTRIVSANCSQSPASLRLPPEDVAKIIQIDRDAKELNDALSELKEEAKKQNHSGKSPTVMLVEEFRTPSLSPEVINATRTALRNNLASAKKTVRGLMGIMVLPYTHPGVSKELTDARCLCDLAHRALEEFNAVYPEEK